MRTLDNFIFVIETPYFYMGEFRKCSLIPIGFSRDFRRNCVYWYVKQRAYKEATNV